MGKMMEMDAGGGGGQNTFRTNIAHHIPPFSILPATENGVWYSGGYVYGLWYAGGGGFNGPVVAKAIETTEGLLGWVMS